MMDSFPSIWGTREAQPRKLSVRTALTKSSITSDWARALERDTRPHFGIDERESITEGLRQIAAAYERSNESMSEDSDD